MNKILGLLLLTTLICNCSSEKSYHVSSCEDEAGIHVICGTQFPEDMVAIPDSPFIIISEYGNMGGSTGKLVSFNRTNEELISLFPHTHDVTNTKESWGDPQCKNSPPDHFSPHGIDLVKRTSGQWQLFVVNHQSNDRIDMFEVNLAEDQVQLDWRGCVPFPAFAMLNDVAGMSDGSFLTTHMFDKNSSTIGGKNVSLFKGAFLGLSSGHVWQWNTDSSLNVVPNSEGALPNGIAVSPDKKSLFVNVYGSGEVRRINVQSGELEATVQVSGPDNIAWGEDGNLYVASHQPPFKADTSECYGTEKSACGYPFKIVKLDPTTMSSQVVFEHSGAPFGAATIAVQVENSLYMGSFAGNRIAQVDLTQPIASQ